MKQYRFSATSDKEFALTLKKRVNAYFKEKNISKNANTEMVVKVIFSLSLYLVPYLLFVTGIVENTVSILSFAVVA